MLVLAYTVISQTYKMDKYRQKGQERSKVQTDRIRNVCIQSALYILAFMITALPLSVARIYQAKYSCSSTFFPLSMTTVTVFPMQGFWNAIIYFRTRMTKHLAEQQLGKRVTTLLTKVNRSSFFGSSMRSLGSFGSMKDLFAEGVDTSVMSSQVKSGQGSSAIMLDVEDDEEEKHRAVTISELRDIQQSMEELEPQKASADDDQLSDSEKQLEEYAVQLAPDESSASPTGETPDEIAHSEKQRQDYKAQFVAENA